MKKLPNVRTFAVAALALGLLPSAVGASSPKETLLPPGFEPVEVREGITKVEGFAEDGRAATIVRAWRGNGNAHGYNLFLVLLPAASGSGAGGGAGVVGFDEGAAGLHDEEKVSPFDGERVLSALRFGRRRSGGRPQTLAIRADLGPGAGGVLADHAPVVIKMFVLAAPGGSVGTTPDVFKLETTLHPEGRYCNADMALHVVLGLPLPADYAGGPAPSGCID